ncbi:hypothetical protein QQP08_005698 [Theobroma cacao]|uniref:Uncharacterized protein n=1 Tax=Theobroma cacao TaxID=3641 RepID=A0A061EC01_THECC|nr:Uncharacterized protein TCM_008736 [Theobroma cacao]WRX13211.1 hypothetical protein QQP08_005698 [Theobroma cacao]
MRKASAEGELKRTMGSDKGAGRGGGCPPPLHKFQTCCWVVSFSPCSCHPCENYYCGEGSHLHPLIIFNANLFTSSLALHLVTKSSGYNSHSCSNGSIVTVLVTWNACFNGLSTLLQQR